MKLLVCGGRDFADYHALRRAIVTLKPTCIAHGAARGADALADRVATELGIPVRRFPAHWDRYGKSAGMRRNREMLETFRPDAVLAAPGGRGTANMTALAKTVGVPVHRMT
jgi:hypothetical protein